MFIVITKILNKINTLNNNFQINKIIIIQTKINKINKECLQNKVIKTIQVYSNNKYKLYNPLHLLICSKSKVFNNNNSNRNKEGGSLKMRKKHNKIIIKWQ